MQSATFQLPVRRLLAASFLAIFSAHAGADVVTDWNARAGEIIVESKLGTPPAIRVMAIVQTAVHEAVYAGSAVSASGISLEAAVAAANRVTLGKLVPAQQKSIDATYQAALAAIADGPAKANGIAVGERAATAVLAMRADDGAAMAEVYRPHAAAGTYVPTTMPAVPQWQARKPWLMNDAAQFRPAPPPALTSDRWARDFNEVKALGGKASTSRGAHETEIARFWEFSLPPIYYGVVRSVADQPGRDVARNARLYADVSQAMDDAMIAVFDAKYHYNFWRPATAIRNGDADGNEATEREAAWLPFIDTPMHPEYPSAHSILASVVGVVLKAEVGNGRMPVLMTTSPTAKGAMRQWTSTEDFADEVAIARVYEGVHYRFSSEVGADMGRKIGALAAERLLRPMDVNAAAIAAPVGERMIDRIAANGVQVYECRAKAGDASGAEWAFVAPEAELRDAQGAGAGKHYAGPHWEALDGSRIVGTVRARAEAPHAGAIPWLLLSTKSVGGEGRFSKVTSVQRVNTLGGSAPVQGCDVSSIGAKQRVPYTADYVLFAQTMTVAGNSVGNVCRWELC
jgi:hypothetical protein